MIRINTILLMAALGLTMSATATQAANFQIASLPFPPITVPGTYVVTADLSYTAQTGAAITISPNLSGPVIVNLKGHILTGSVTLGQTLTSQCFAVNISGNGPSRSTITIENGTITHFAFGVAVFTDNASGVIGNALSGIDINNINFSFILAPNPGIGIDFANDVVSSTVRNCTFSSGDIGIQAQSAGGNRFTKNTFTNFGQLLVLYGGQNIGAAVTLDACHFDVPTSN
jgi:parallel beta-helix repeat protein